MPSREDFLRLIWADVINGTTSGAWIENAISQANATPNGQFADAGLALQRLTSGGASPRDLQLVTRAAIYEAVFNLLYMLDDPGVDDGNVFMLHESLLSADPSGLEGRPGSAPEIA